MKQTFSQSFFTSQTSIDIPYDLQSQDEPSTDSGEKRQLISRKDSFLPISITSANSLFVFSESSISLTSETSLNSEAQSDIFTKKSLNWLNSASLEEAKPIMCRVCGKSFTNRSNKYNHKRKYKKGSFCNIPDPRGRPFK